MDLILSHTMRVRRLKRRLEACRKKCASLAADFELATMVDERAAIGRKWQEAVKESHAVQYLLEQLEKREREEQTG